MRIGVCSVLQAELWSNSDALVIARNGGYRNVEVEMDSIQALK